MILLSKEEKMPHNFNPQEKRPSSYKVFLRLFTTWYVVNDFFKSSNYEYETVTSYNIFLPLFPLSSTPDQFYYFYCIALHI